MKRLVWLLASVCCLAFAQVQPVALPAPADDGCNCCCSGTDCGCALPGCAVPPPSRAPVPAQPAVRIALSRTVCRAAQPRIAARFFHVCTTPALLLASAPVTSLLPPPASAAIFLAHCSLRI